MAQTERDGLKTQLLADEEEEERGAAASAGTGKFLTVRRGDGESRHTPRRGHDAYPLITTLPIKSHGILLIFLSTSFWFFLLPPPRPPLHCSTNPHSRVTQRKTNPITTSSRYGSRGGARAPALHGVVCVTQVCDGRCETSTIHRVGTFHVYFAAKRKTTHLPPSQNCITRLMTTGTVHVTKLTPARFTL
jgi:hypothetical protein